MANEAEQAIYNRLASAPTFHPATADIFATDWGLDAGDVVAVRSGNDTYNVPVYNMSLNWKGNSRVQIQSTGNETRKPLSALKRRQYGGGSARHKEIEELGVQYSQQFVVSDKRVASIMSATGVLLDENNEPVTAYNPDTDEYEYVFDTTGAGATLASHVSQTAGKLATEVTARTAQGVTLNSRITQTATEINSTVSALDGRVSEIKQTVDGIALTGNTITIKGNSINLDGYVTADSIFSSSATHYDIYAADLYADSITLSGTGLLDAESVVAGSITALDEFYIGGNEVTNIIIDASVSSDGKTLTLTPLVGTPINFSKPASTKVSGAWSGATYTVSADDNGQDLPISATVGLHISSTWDYDDGLDKYQKTVQIRSGTTVVATDYIDKPDSVISTITLSNPYDTKPSASEYDEDGGLLTASKYYIVTATADTGGTKKIVLQVPSGEYTEYRVQSSWRSYTPGTSSSSRTLTIIAQGKNSAGNWVQIASASRTIRANHYWNDDEQKYETTIT